jgi:rod shape determining protein RodA
LNTFSSSPIFSSARSALQLLGRIDWWLVGSTAILVSVGLSVLRWSQPTLFFFDKQFEFLCVGVILLITFSLIPYTFWTKKGIVAAIYLINLVLLLAVMIKGHSAQGAQRWLTLGPLTLQPSEVAKIVVIFTLASWLGTRPIRSFFDLFKLMVIIAPPALLVFKQPDLGTSLTFQALFLGTTYWAGATVSDLLILISPVISLIFNAVDHQWWLIFLGLLFLWLLAFWRRKDWSFLIRILLIIMVIGANYGAGLARPHLWGLLKEYQQKRLTSFVNPYDDPQGSGYHILQSLIAIGSGGLSGTGLAKGNQSQGSFIPERHTDFIFAVIGEELGFKISVLVILAYAFICFRALSTARQSKEDLTGGIMAIGIMSMFLFHVFLNVGMTMGIMPVAGVPLPFLSYGGTALLVDCILIGLLQSIQFRQAS